MNVSSLVAPGFSPAFFILVGAPHCCAPFQQHLNTVARSASSGERDSLQSFLE
jgi:hypothetical protein